MLRIPSRIVKNRCTHRRWLFGMRYHEKIIGHIFFEYTITAGRYQNILLYFNELLEKKDRYSSLQHDGATSHYAGSTSDSVNGFIGDCLVG